MKPRVVCFADSHGWYRAGLNRLIQSCNTHSVEVVSFTHHDQLGCRPHVEVPYGFKTYALLQAASMQDAGVLLYCDASMECIADPRPCFEFIERHGWLFEQCGFMADRITSDAALVAMGRSRESVKDCVAFSAGFVGLDVRNELAMQFLDDWHRWSVDGRAFQGPWTNRNGEASSDPRVIGHRHDLSVGSIIAHDLGMDTIVPTFMRYHVPGQIPVPGTCFIAKGGV